MDRKTIKLELFLSLVKFITDKDGFGVQQITLARYLGVSPVSIYMWLKKRHVPSHEHVVALKKFYDKQAKIFGFDMASKET